MGEGFECVYVGSLPVEVELAQQEVMKTPPRLDVWILLSLHDVSTLP